MDYKVIKTGSDGNCVAIENLVVDAGLTIKAFPWERVLDIGRLPKKGEEYNVIGCVYVTHTHSDHIKESIAKKLLTLGVPLFTSVANKLRRKHNPLYGIKVKHRELWEQINFVEDEFEYDDGYFKYHVRLDEQVEHNVPNFPIHIKLSGLDGKETKVFYCTDMGSLLGVKAKDYDYYFVETNYCERRVAELEHVLKSRSKYNRFKRTREEHFSKQQCMRWYHKNRKEIGSKLIQLHKSKVAYR